MCFFCWPCFYNVAPCGGGDVLPNRRREGLYSSHYRKELTNMCMASCSKVKQVNSKLGSHQERQINCWFFIAICAVASCCCFFMAISCARIWAC